MPITYATEDWYDTPRGYDLVFDEDTPQATDFLEQVYARHGDVKGTRGPRRVFEPACGSGRLMVEFARRGWRVSGSDLSQPMLDYARDRLDGLGLAGSLSLGDMAEPRPRGRFHLAHCLVSTFKYLLEERQARGNLAGMARALHPGGLYVLGLHLTDYATSSLTRERWVVERDGTHVVCNIQGWPADRKRRVERVRSRLIVREGGQERRTETVWDFRTYDVRQLSRLLASVPELEHAATYDFRYDVNEPCIFGVDQVDTILVLRRR